MSKLIKSGAALSAVALAVTTQSAPASAAGASATPTYNGTWYEATADTCTQVPVTGRWSVTLKKDGSASVGVTIFMDGKLHAAWGGNALGDKFTWTQTANGYVLALGDVTFTIDGDQMRFDIPQLYPTCDATVLGTVA
jgi:uncharacterized protein with LGFP repeats